MFYEMITGSFPYPTYPLRGLTASRYAAVDAAVLGAVHPVLAELTLGLVRWDPAQRLTLADAQARLTAPK